MSGCDKTVIEPDIKIDGDPAVTLDFGTKAGSKSITVVSTADWSVASIPDWITVVPPSGTG